MTVTETSPRRPSPWAGHTPGRQYRRILFGLFAAGIATFAQLYAPQGLLPSMATGLGVGAAQAAASISIATLGVALAVLPWSWVADRFGRLRAMQVAISSAAALGLAVPFSPSVEVLLTLRLFEGVALAGLPALAIAYLHDEIAPRYTVAAAATYIAGTSLGGASGRLIAGPLTEQFGWRPALLAVALLCTVAALVFCTTMPKALGYQAVPTPVRAVWVGVRGNLANPALRRLYAAGLLWFGSFVGLYNYLGFRLEGPEFGLPTAVASLIFLAYAAGALGARLSGRWVPRFGSTRVLTGACAAMLLGAGLSICGWLPLVVVGLLLLTAGFFTAHAVTSSSVARLSTVGRTQATAVYNVGIYSGSALLGWLLGYLWQGLGWTAVTVAFMAAVVLGLLLVRRTATPAAG